MWGPRVSQHFPDVFELNGVTFCHGGLLRTFVRALPEQVAAADLRKAFARLEPLIRAKIRERSHDEWIDVLTRNDVPVTTVTTLDTVFDDPQLAERGMILRGEGIRYVNYPVPMEGVDAARHDEPHRLGQDNAAVLGAAGYTPQQIASLSK